MIIDLCGAVASESRTREIVRERAAGICEVCQAARLDSFHHRRKPGRSWCPCNVLATCGDGTTGCHGRIEHNPTEAKEQGWWVEPWFAPHEMPVWLPRWGGFVLLDAHGDYDLLTDDRLRLHTVERIAPHAR